MTKLIFLILIAVGVVIGVVGTILVNGVFEGVGWMQVVKYMTYAAVGGLGLYAVVTAGRLLLSRKYRATLDFVRSQAKMILNPPKGIRWVDHAVASLRGAGEEVYKSVRLGAMVWLGSTLLSPLVLGLFSVVAAMCGLAQLDGLVAQSKIAASEQQFSLAHAEAQAAYTYISETLLNPQSSPDEHVFALQGLPEAMLIAVPCTDVAEGQGGKIKVSVKYPNVLPLKRVLGQFMRRTRLLEKEAILAVNTAEPRSKSWEIVDGLKPSGGVGEELLHCIYRLGPTDPVKPERCLWKWNPESKKPPPAIRPRVSKSKSLSFDLSFLTRGQSISISIPTVKLGSEWKLCLTSGANLRRSQLVGLTAIGSLMIGSDLKDAQAQWVDLRGSDLSCSLLERTNLKFANLRECSFHGASFADCELSGADLSGGKFYATKISIDGRTIDAPGVLIERASARGSFTDPRVGEFPRLVSIDESGKVLRAQFVGPDGGAWLDQQSASLLVQALGSEYHQELAANHVKASEAIDAVRNELATCNTPAGQTDLRDWSASVGRRREWIRTLDWDGSEQRKQ